MESSRHSTVAKRMTFMIDDILRIERASKSSSSSLSLSSHAPHSTGKQYSSGLRGHDDVRVDGERDDSRYKAMFSEVACNDVSPSDGAEQYRGKCAESIQQDGSKVSKLTSGGSRCSRTQSSSRKDTFPVDAPVEETASWFGPSGQTGEMPCSDESLPNDLSSYRGVADRSPVSAAAAAAALFRLCHAHRMHSIAARDRDDIIGQSSPAADGNTATRGFWSTLLVPNPSESPAVSPAASQTFRHPVASFSSSLPPFPFPLINFARSTESHVTAAMAAAAAMTNAVPGVMIRGDVTAGVGSGVEHFLRLKCRRNRTVFSEFHLTSLEKNFDRQKYLSTKDRAQLAARLGLSQIQVKTWYQNRRMKWKKQVIQQGGTQPPTKPKGRPRKHEEDQEQTEDQLCDVKEL